MAVRYNEDGSITDGIFDDQSTHCREVYVEGVLKRTLSHLWIHTTDPEARARLNEDWMTPPFGTYPNLPKRKKNI